jgi:hypothetical protein
VVLTGAAAVSSYTSCWRAAAIQPWRLATVLSFANALEPEWQLLWRGDLERKRKEAEECSFSRKDVYKMSF